MALVGDLAPPTTAEQRRTGLQLAQAHLHGLGITGWQDAIVGSYAGWPDPLETYLEAAAAGTLTARVRGALWWDRTRGLEQVEELVARRASAGRFTAATVKVMQDGVPENFTAAMSTPYLDRCGHATDRTRAVDGRPRRAHRGGRAAHRPRASRCTSTPSATGRSPRCSTRSRRRSRRTATAGCGTAWPTCRSCGRTTCRASGGSAWWPTCSRSGRRTSRRWTTCASRSSATSGPGWQYPFGDLLRSGATLAGGSDWPVSSADPLAGISVAVNRRLPDAPAGTPVFLPDQRVDLGTALAAYTAGSAYVNGLDDTGTIRVGALADLAVLDRDPFDGPAGGRVARAGGVDVRGGGAGAPGCGVVSGGAVSFAQGLVRPDVSAARARRGRAGAVRRRRRAGRAREPAGPQLPGRRLRAQGRPPVVPDAELDAQDAALLHLAGTPGLAVPVPQRARDGGCGRTLGRAARAAAHVRARARRWPAGTTSRRSSSGGSGRWRAGWRRGWPTSSTPGWTGCCSGTCGRRGRWCEQLAPYVPPGRREVLLARRRRTRATGSTRSPASCGCSRCTATSPTTTSCASAASTAGRCRPASSTSATSGSAGWSATSRPPARRCCTTPPAGRCRCCRRCGRTPRRCR